MRSFFGLWSDKFGRVSVSSKHLSRRRIARAIGIAVEQLETRILFGAGANNTTGANDWCPICPPSTGPGAAPQATGSGNSGPANSSTGPINLFSGTPVLSVTDIQSDGFGIPWGVTRVWMGQPDMSQLGNGWMNSSTPFLAVTQNGFGG